MSLPSLSRNLHNGGTVSRDKDDAAAWSVNSGHSGRPGSRGLTPLAGRLPTGSPLGSDGASKASEAFGTQSFDSLSDIRSDRLRSAENKTMYAKTLMRRSLDSSSDKLENASVREAMVDGSSVGYYQSEQNLINKELKQKIIDLEAAIEGMHINQMQRCIAMRTDSNDASQKSLHELENYHDHMQWDTPLDYSADHLCAELKLGTTPASLARLGGIKMFMLNALTPTLTELLMSQARPARLQQIKEQLEEMTDPLTLGEVELLDPIMKLQKLVHSDVLKLVEQELAATRPRLQQLQKELDINERERGLALHFNDITEATEKHVTSVKMLEEMIDIMRKRLNELMLGFQDPEDYMSEYGSVRKETEANLQRFKQNKLSLKDQIEKDVQAVKDGIEKAAENDKLEHEKSSKCLEESQQRIMANMQQQDELWVMLQESMEKIKTLGEAHAHQMTVHMNLVEAEAKRRYALGEFNEIAAKHLTTLAQALKHTETALTMADAVEDYLSLGLQKAKDKHVGDKLEKLKLDEMQKYCEVFRKYGLVAGDLIDRKEKRLAGFKHFLKNLEFGSAMAVDALDSDREKYEQEAKEYRRRADELQKEIMRLKLTLEDATTDFNATEEQLEESGIEFVSPQIEMQEALIEKKKTYLDKRRALLYDDQKELDMNTSELQKMDVQCKNQSGIITERREILKARKPWARRPGSATASTPTGTPARTPEH